MFLLLAGQLKAQTPDANSILYVDGSATGNGTGSSWQNAITSLADALKYANDNKASYSTGVPLKIYVSKGTYKPAYSPQTFITGGRQNSFLLVANVQLYGGFDPGNGIDDLTDARIYGESGTILSGDVNGDDVVSGSGSSLVITQNTDNNFHVVISAGDVGSAVLDGFTVAGGNSDNSASYVTVNGVYNISTSEGGGMHIVSSSPQLVGCTFTQNRGYWYAGGMFISSSSPTLTDCAFVKNIVSSLGGGIYNSASSPTLTNCNFSGNSAPSGYGGGMANYNNSAPTLNGCVFSGNYGYQSGGVRNVSSSPVFSNCRFILNSVVAEGGGMHNISSSVSFTNCSFLGNSAGSGGALHNDASSTSITGCLFAGNLSGSSGAINNFVSQSTMINVTMAKNGTVGLYIYGSGGLANLQNCIIWDEVIATGQGSGVGAYLSSYSIIKSKTDISNGNINAGSLSGNDIFADFSNDDFTLKQSSPAVNSGNNSLYLGLAANTADLLGNTRLAGATIDMGAYEYQSALPVVFLDFTAKADHNNAKLQWRTTNEINNKGFVVFRSRDGKSFTKLHTQTSNFQGQLTTYNFTDYSPSNGANYYRLTQVDLDGNETELGTRVLNFSFSSQEVLAYPNPVVDKLNVNFATAQYQRLVLVDATGRKLKEYVIKSNQVNLELEMINYNKGIYFIALKGVGGNKLLKVLK